MDSYNFHFERMSNVDLHPLSLPVSRLSPAKSNSSIVDQFAHHQHGKGDSAYSSFSGGSNAPDYPSSFLAEELQSNSFGHYADLKYVKSIYHPSQLLQSDSKTMDQLYRSVEAISQQYRNNSHHNSNESFHSNNKVTKQEVPLGAPIPYSRPPPVPARLDSFIATKNLENNRVQHHGTESQPQQPQPQQPRHHQRLHRQSHGLRSGPANTETSDPDPVYGDWRAGAPQSQQLPSYRLHLQPQDQTRVPLSPEYLSVTDNKAASEQKSTNVLSRSPPRGTSQSEHLKPRQLSSSGGSNGDHHNNPIGSGSHFESQRKRAHSAHDLLGAEPTRAASPWNVAQSVINSSIQHKGQFYFVTGVCKSSESGLRTQSVSVCGSDAGSESSSVFERQQLREKERCHSTMDNLFKPLKESSRSSSGVISDGKEGLPYENQGKDLISKNLDQENHRPSLLSTRSSRSFDSLEEIDMSREIGRHTANNPIFYCGPDRNCSPHPSQQMKEVASLLCNDQSNPHMRDEPAKRGKRQPLTDVASQRINKETTPLLYHLTGASRAALQPKKDADFSAKGNEGAPNKASSGDLIVNNSDRPPQGHATKSDREDNSNACNTLDDSFKKYYKEKLKDAQSKVLRETSFKRRDLQLSWPHRIRQKPELRPTVIHSFSSSQDSGTSTDTLTPSVASEETEKGSIKEEAEESQKEVNKETEKENGRPAKVAQPQVARIKGRKRLTPEQKKMCYSEPDKLNQLGRTPKHSACRSFGNESEGLFPLDYDREEYEPQGEQGLVAARRKMFETRGRALSASSASKTNLKHLRHKALVEYMERKTGHKMAEPQQPAAQQPPPPRQRHSLGEKPFDWGPRPLSAHHEGKTPKKKPNRPHSAGRILDSSTSSIRYAQFFPAQSSPGQYPAQSNESRWRESQGPSQGKFASAESLLDQPEPPKVFRNRSTSTPHAFQAHDFEQDPLPVNTMETPRPEVTAVADTGVMLPPEAQRRERVVAQRGKSMEELGASKLTRVSALSKSSEQLDQMRRRSAGPAASERDKRNVSFLAEVREARGQERARNEAEEVEKSAQGQADMRRRSLLKQNSEPALGEEGDVAPLGKAGTRTPSRSASPASGASARARVHSASPRSHSPATEELRLSRPPSETPSNPPSPRGQETSEREIKSTSSSPTQTKPPCEGRLSARSARTSPSATGAESEQSVDELGKEDPPLESKSEVSLSCGVTTDPSLWVLPTEDEEDIKDNAQSQPLTDDVFEPPPSSTPPPHTSEASVLASPSDVTQRDDTERTPEAQEPEENREAEERATVEPAGEGEREEESTTMPPEKPRWEELVEAVVKADPSLVTALYPLANRKTALMLMEQLLSEDTLLMEEHYKKKQEQRGSEESAETVEVVEASPQLNALDNAEPTEPQSKADLTEKKHLLVSHLEERLHSLEESRGALQAEVLENAAHGEALRELVAQRCQPLELERYSQFIGDLERVVSLLLCLSARLARVQNALSTVDQHTDADEKQSLDSRHRLLCKQREDAKDLKDNLDRRESQVSAFLSRQLTAEQLQGYRRFVQTKASLLIRQKDLEERLRLGHEQLEALSTSLNL